MLALVMPSVLLFYSDEETSDTSALLYLPIAPKIDDRDREVAQKMKCKSRISDLGVYQIFLEDEIVEIL
ncbi:hypothetical protein CEXT_558071 [Caerostris extrusa]|uniref:Uncharacterized protein n=1 Tax=Caerostris extrusa TaxID=172846 RepID=A0AAV4XUR6_CAEEX|nr:hypothetical protein CEXT_558071 [Caerostris extrusa]